MGDFIDEVTDWLKALILGDFDDEQPVSAQVVGGVISLIPGIDQLMDVRDIAGCLFRINRKGGMAHASRDDCILLGFAALGAIPTVGSVFKTVFKPLWKERRAVGAAMRGGVEMVERLLGMGKGGAIRWVRNLQWAGLTQQAIALANGAIDSMVQMLSWLAATDRWWIPDALESLAKDTLPGVEGMRGKLDRPIREGLQAIREFIEELLGEDAAAVVVAVAQSTPSTASGPRAAAARRSRGRGGATQQHPPIAGQQTQQVDTGHSHTGSRTTRPTRATWPNVSQRMQGIVGEHIVDYHCLEGKGWGRGWTAHDRGNNGRWQPADPLRNLETPGKINDDGKLVEIGLSPRGRGIDGVWRKKASGPQKYAIVEAKCYINPAKSLGDMLADVYDKNEYANYRHQQRGARGQTGGGSRRSQAGGGSRRSGGQATPAPAPAPAPPSTSPAKPSRDVMQMGHRWIDQRLDRYPDAVRVDIRRKYGNVANYSRHVMLVSVPNVAQHFEAFEAAVLNGGQMNADDHRTHTITREFGDAQIQAELSRRGGR